MPKDFKSIVRKIKKMRWVVLIALFALLYVLNTVFPGEYKKPLGLVVGVFLYWGGNALMRSKMSNPSLQVQEKPSKRCFRCGTEMRYDVYSLDYCD